MTIACERRGDGSYDVLWKNMPIGVISLDMVESGYVYRALPFFATSYSMSPILRRDSLEVLVAAVAYRCEQMED